MGRLTDRVVREALRKGMRRGIGDGSRAWLMVGAAALGVRVMQRLAAPKPIVVTERLEPGQTITIRHLAAGE